MPTARFDAPALIAEYGDEGFIAELAVLLLSHADEQVTAVREAIATGNAAALRSAAHRIKGGMGTFGADAVTSRAAALEALGRENRLDGAASLAEELAQEVHALCEDARVWLASRAA